MYGQKRLKVSNFFSTSDLDFQKLLRGYYGFNYMEFTVFCALYQLKSADTSQILEKIDHGWPRNKVNSALKKIDELNLCVRERVTNNQSRGYRYVYHMNDLNEIKNEIISSFMEWLTVVESEMENLDFHLEQFDTKVYMRKKRIREEERQKWYDD